MSRENVTLEDVDQSLTLPSSEDVAALRQEISAELDDGIAQLFENYKWPAEWDQRQRVLFAIARHEGAQVRTGIVVQNFDDQSMLVIDEENGLEYSTTSWLEI
jgi:hypothetical protein